MEAVITEINAWAWGADAGPPAGHRHAFDSGLGFSHLEASGVCVSIAARGFKGEVSDIPPFRALMTSLSATIGTGNIAGVATAMTLGGRGLYFGCG